MDSWLLCGMLLCLPGSGFMEPGITQTPKHLVTVMGGRGTLKCKQHLGHNAMYWYKQNPQEPPELMFYYNNKELLDNKTVSNRFSPECPDKSQLFLHMGALQPGDSALYLCASSKDTALQREFLPVHKLP